MLKFSPPGRGRRTSQWDGDYNYSWSSQQLRKAWNLIASRLVDISQPDLRPWETHEGPCWWRSPDLRPSEIHEWSPWWRLASIRRRRSFRPMSYLKRVLKRCLPERLLKLLRKFKAPAPSSTESRLQGRT